MDTGYGSFFWHVDIFKKQKDMALPKLKQILSYPDSFYLLCITVPLKIMLNIKQCLTCEIVIGIENIMSFDRSIKLLLYICTQVSILSFKCLWVRSMFFNSLSVSGHISLIIWLASDRRALIEQTTDPYYISYLHFCAVSPKPMLFLRTVTRIWATISQTKYICQARHFPELQTFWEPISCDTHSSGFCWYFISRS